MPKSKSKLFIKTSKLIPWLQNYKLPLVSVTSFMIGAFAMKASHFMTPVVPSDAQVVELTTEQAPAKDSEGVAEENGTDQGGSFLFWEPAQQMETLFLDSNFEIVNIEPEKTPEVTEEIVDQILSDYQGRISPEFEIPSMVFNQTKFWFRVYTEFNSNHKIIHDSLHPHIIYDVVDVSDIMTLPARAPWLNTLKAQKVVSKRVAEIRQKLKKMTRKNKAEMDREELGWLSQLSSITGDQKKIINLAAKSLRVQTGQKDFFENGLSMSGRYLEGMEAIFKAKGLPQELTRLPFVESSFVIGATSKVGAAGIWQFMPSIGRKFMQVDQRVDERRNPWKATEAAARLLKENYTILHKNWGLALTAYNHGPAGVRRAMQKVKSRDIAKIVRSYRSRNFDFASANFYTCFLAAVHAQMYKDILWRDHIYEPTLSFDIVKLHKSYKPSKLVEATGLSDDQILLYNPELDRTFKRQYLIPRGYRLFLPKEASAFQSVVADTGVAGGREQVYQ